MIIKIKNPMIICIIVSFFFGFEFFQINVFSSLDTELIKKFNCTTKELGVFSSMYFYGNLLLLIPAGILLDKYSTRSLILFSMFFSIIGIYIFSFSNNLYISSIGRLIIGMTGGAICFLSSLKLCSQWFHINEMPKIISIIISIGMLGGILSQAPFNFLINKFGYTNALYINIYFGIFLYFIIYLFIYDFYKIQKNNFSFLFSFKNIIKNTKNWYCGIYISLLNLPIFLLGALYGNIYLVQIHNLSHNEASIVTTMIYLGMLIGSLLLSKFLSKKNNRIFLMTFGIFLCIIIVFILINIIKLTFFMLLIIFFILGLSSSAQIIAYPIIMENNDINIIASSNSFSSMLIVIGGAIFQPLFGYIIKLNLNDPILQDIIYIIKNFNNGFYLLIFNLIISFIMILLIFEKISIKFMFYK
ncbi:MAG: MFS transporter [Candidatus Azosocius agrarius]|nr:MAG: MFS transporter [Gammaproteobacteria bacterium]